MYNICKRKNMESYLLKFVTKGLKNINKDVEISFYNDTISKGELLGKQFCKVKGIFGSNGFGKTAIIKSVATYVDLIKKPDFLYQSFVKNNLLELINKEIHEFTFVAYYAFTHDDTKKIFKILKHEICICYSADVTDFKVKYEKIYEIKGRTLNENAVTIFDSSNGYDALKHYTHSEYDEELIKSAMNRLDKNSIVRIAYNLIQGTTDRKITLTDESLVNTCLLLLNGVFNTITVIDSEDDYESNAIFEKYRMLKLFQEMIAIDEKGIVSPKDFIDDFINKNDGSDIVLTKDLEKYENMITTMYSFISIFKDDLLSISIDKEKIDGERVKCTLMFDYKKYSVNLKYESAGIRRIVHLFRYLGFCKDGGILFVDELDRCLSSVILSKLITYFSKYGKGQLCFTSHSLDMLSALNKQKHSIDFVNNDGALVSWSNDGNKNPSSFYKKGLIEGIHFNLEDFDFIRAFGD